MVSHDGTAGHNGADATLNVLSETFWCSAIEQAIGTRLRGFRHYLVTRAGEIIPRPLGSSLLGSMPNEVIHMDVSSMAPGLDGNSYTLLIRDYLSS